MAGKHRARWSTHRRLVVLEALLLVGVLEMAAEDRIVASDFPDELKIAFVMLLVLGFFGSFLVVLERVARSGLGTTHRTIRSLPIPMPRIFIHVLVLLGLFLAYAGVLNLWPSWFPA